MGRLEFSFASQFAICPAPRQQRTADQGDEVDWAWGGMADDLEKMDALRAIRDILVEQLVRLEQLGDSRSAAELSPAIERLNGRLGEQPSEEEIQRLRRKYFTH
jgi:hypothetical protein